MGFPYDNNTILAFIDELNRQEVDRLTPLIIYFVCIILTGLPGNFIVVLVYKKSYRQSNSKMFVLWLAVIDLINCVILFLEIANVLHQYNYYNVWLCKMTIFFTIWPTLTSGFSLCLIGFERYRKVCKPLAWQVSHKMARVQCGVIVAVALLCSWPALILFGIRDITIHPYNLTGNECSFQNNYDGTTILLVYNGFLWVLFVVCLSVIGTFYVMIGKRVFKQVEKAQVRRKQSVVASSSASDSNFCNDELPSSDMSSDRKSVNRLTKFSASITASHSQENISQVRRQTQAKRSAFIMFLISLTFMVSFVPYLVLRMNEAMDATFVSSMSNGGRAAYKFFLRSYFLNCATNPFIYCAFASQFRKEVKALFKRPWRSN